MFFIELLMRKEIKGDSGSHFMLFLVGIILIKM